MNNFVGESINEVYPQILETLLKEGDDVSPRGYKTKELHPACIQINNPRKRVLSHSIRNCNYGFMVGELLWILQGSNKLDHVAHYNKQWEQFSDDGETLNGAYGQRIFNWDGLFDVIDTTYKDEEGNTHPNFELMQITMDQFECAYNKLYYDKYTRQATISLFNPVQDYNSNGTKDTPCTNIIRFMIRNNKLDMTVFMRSNDIILGTPYDIFNFTMLQEIMAGRLNIDVGIYYHIIDSLHIYDNHYEMAQNIIDNPEKDIYDNIMYDARLNNDEFIKELKIIFDIENTTRLTGALVDVKNITDLLDSTENYYWQSIGALIALYNFRKHKRSQEELDVFKPYIINEFKKIDKINNYKTLKK